MAANFDRISDDLELKAAAAVAHVLDAKLIRRDLPPAQNTRDFDLILADGSVEPLEVTRFVDRPALEAWERLRKHTPLMAPSLTRRWVLAVPIVDRAGSRAPYDAQRFVHELAHALGLGYRDLGRKRAEARVWPLADRADPRALGPVGRQSSSVAASAISSHWACQSSPIAVRTSHVAPASA